MRSCVAFRQPQTHPRFLDNRSGQCCTVLQTAVVCPEFSEPRWLSTAQIAALLRIPLRTAKHRVAKWYEQQHLPVVPRVERVSRGVGGVQYRVDRESCDALRERIAA